MTKRFRRIPIIGEDARRAERYRALTEGIADGDIERRLCLEFTLDVMARLATKNRFGENFERGGKDVVKAILEGRLAEETTTTDLGNVPNVMKHMFPVVARIFWSMTLFDLVSVQPMSKPTGKVFFRNVRYSSTGGLYEPSLYSPGARVDKYLDPDYALSTEAPGNAVKELAMDMTDLDVTAETRRLNATWTDELEQDLRAYFGLEMDSLAVQDLGDEIAREIDTAGLELLLAGATAGNVNWSQTPSGAYASLDPKIYARTLWDALIDADRLVRDAINRRTTWIVASGNTVDRLRKLGEHKLTGADANEGGGSAQHALEYQGLLGERWRVYEARWFPDDKILLGYRGERFDDTAAVYAPYLPMQVKDAIKDLKGTDAYKTIRGVQTRSVTKVVQGDGMATVTITA